MTLVPARRSTLMTLARSSSAAFVGVRLAMPSCWARSSIRAGERSMTISESTGDTVGAAGASGLTVPTVSGVRGEISSSAEAV